MLEGMQQIYITHIYMSILLIGSLYYNNLSAKWCNIWPVDLLCIFLVNVPTNIVSIRDGCTLDPVFSIILDRHGVD